MNFERRVNRARTMLAYGMGNKAICRSLVADGATPSEAWFALCGARSMNALDAKEATS